MDSLTLEIRGLGSAGEGVGDSNGYTVFVDGALPGELIEAELAERKSRHGFGKLLRIVRPSPDRTQPQCLLFGCCGGCQLMHLSYAKQLETKRQRVVDALKRIGKIDVPVDPCLPSPSPLAYRNKIQLPVKEGVFGLYAKSSHDLVPVENCPIHCDLGEEIYRAVKPILAAYPIKDLRHLLIKSAVRTKQALAILVTSSSSSSLNEIGETLLAAHPALKGVIHNRHSGKENVILGPSYTTLAGIDSIREELCGLLFEISPASFFQVNPAQAERLYEKALEFAQLSGHETVVDAYCGVGTLALVFARLAKKAIGIECVPQAIENAKKNATLNGIKNASFYCAKAENHFHKIPKADVVLLNPPRKGCDASLLDAVGTLAPEKVVYVSCDPATLARDLAHLIRHGYKALKIQPFDMFPQTAHVESLALLMQNR